MIRRHMPLLLAAILVAPLTAADPVTFRQQTVDDKVQIGYGTAIGDVDGDGKPDILLADKKRFVWYKNPTWKKFVIAENLTVRDNVCIAARDINGDGKVEIAVGGQWNPGDTINSGSVHYLIAPADRTKKWKAIKLQNEPTVHRMRWVSTGSGQYVLVVAPLHGRGNRGGQGKGVRLLAYHVPSADKQSDAAAWKTQLLDDSLHVTHNLDPAQWDPATAAEEILYIGREGALLLSFTDGKWNKKRFERAEGGGEIRMGKLSKTRPFLATIEPLHGDKLVCYPGTSLGATALSDRIVLDSNLKQGHAIATAEFFGGGPQEVVAGWRNPNKDKKVGIKLYYAADQGGKTWKSMWVDDNTMATEDVRIGDLNDDGRPDIVAAGRASHNLKIYWNEK